MTACVEDRKALAAYLDGELPAEQERGLHDHLRTCPECAAEIAAMVAMRRAMRPAGTRFAPSAEFRRKVQGQIAQKQSLGLGSRWLWSFAVASLAVMLLAVIWTRQSTARNAAFREVADLHVSDLASANPYDVVSFTTPSGFVSHLSSIIVSHVILAAFNSSE